MKGTYYLVTAIDGRQFLYKHNMRLVAKDFNLSHSALQDQLQNKGFFFDKKTGTKVVPLLVEKDYLELQCPMAVP